MRGLQEEQWSIERHLNQWVLAHKGEDGFLFFVLKKGELLAAPQHVSLIDLQVRHWEAIIFCPEGLSSQDLKQPALQKIQAWFIDLQTGSIFAAPATEKRDRLNKILSYLESNPSVGTTQASSTGVPTNSGFSTASEAVTFRPYLTYSLIFINLFIFAMMTLAGGSTNTGVLIMFGAKVNSLILQGEYWRLFTSMFLHIGVIHLAFNLYALWALGPILEELFGRIRYLLIYISSGVMGSAASFLFTDAISAGASGAIFGILGALVVYSRSKPFLWKSGFGKNLVIIVLINLSIGFFQPGIDVYAHIGGLLSGMLLAAFVSMK
ncbi:putative membrane protein [Desulfitobacterium dichloroeliminans LMG P-21439]|uniref:Putative membrane protein n=1 Tax=Desulfitobacterium dichloroeliminans (strain LMG P-21439 / DCA1) TaxID=871963 RepID=L0F8I1_DESDL|nr:rhomboid family intramembrane serine protease [Desulfitobacterium dichloroeliminans]AGA69345.1 putative membrane protein [Desulfitobacterium dichloroeliminans LMG P-21439]